MKQKIIVYGTGASARGFLSGLAESFDVIAVASETPQNFDILPFSSVHTRDIMSLKFDFVVVASWAIHDIRERLNNIDVPDEEIYWYQHHKDRLVPWGHEDCFMEHQELETRDILYACYDMNVSRATYDFLGFLCLAESYRIELACQAMHVVIVNAENNEFNQSRWGVHSLDEHHWRLSQILIPCCKLLSSCSGVSQTASRSEAQKLVNSENHVFPKGYSVASPVGIFEFNHLFDRVAEGFGVNYLQASRSALNYIDKYLSMHNPKNKSIVSITLRQTHGKPKRNSDISAWQKVAHWLIEFGYFVVVVPDTDNPIVTGFEGCWVADVVCFNVELRMALYQRSYLNLGVNNGPMHLCAMNSKVDYLMYKQVVEEYPHSSLQSFIDRGFQLGGNFPDATKTQKFIWEDDNFEVIKKTVLEMMDVKSRLSSLPLSMQGAGS